jgi:hypothetical protein
MYQLFLIILFFKILKTSAFYSFELTNLINKAQKHTFLSFILLFIALEIKRFDNFQKVVKSLNDLRCYF